MSDPILIADHLHKSYGQIQAVRDVSLTIARGEVFGLLGPNGAGKTTLISMLVGLIPATQGRIVVAGRDLAREARAVKSRVGLVPQDLALYPSLSARDNLAFFGRIYGLTGQRLRERVDAVLQLVGLAERGDDAIQTYSGGMKRRINIAAGLLHEPELLFLDEPTVGVDPQSRNAIFESVEALSRSGVTVIYTTHYMEEAQRLCQRVAIMDQGRIIALDTPTALIRRVGEGLIRVGLPADRMDEIAGQIACSAAVKQAVRRDGLLHIEALRPQEALLELLDLTNRLDVRIVSLEILEANLETVFLHLTGKRLRD
ncbi:MAG: ABC transporter ATP-binding protein [Anaerolineae bacterium]